MLVSSCFLPLHVLWPGALLQGLDRALPRDRNRRGPRSQRRGGNERVRWREEPDGVRSTVPRRRRDWEVGRNLSQASL